MFGIITLILELLFVISVAILPAFGVIYLVMKYDEVIKGIVNLFFK